MKTIAAQAQDKAAEIVGRYTMQAQDNAGVASLPAREVPMHLDEQDKLAYLQARAALAYLEQTRLTHA